MKLLKKKSDEVGPVVLSPCLYLSVLPFGEGDHMQRLSVSAAV